VSYLRKTDVERDRPSLHRLVPFLPYRPMRHLSELGQGRWQVNRAWLRLPLAATQAAGPLARDGALALVEAVLFLAEEPITPKRIAEVVGLRDAGEARRLVRRLQSLLEAEGSSFQVQAIAGGYQLTTLPQFQPWLVRLRPGTGDLRLSAAAKETLAIIALPPADHAGGNRGYPWRAMCRHAAPAHGPRTGAYRRSAQFARSAGALRYHQEIPAAPRSESHRGPAQRCSTPTTGWVRISVAIQLTARTTQRNCGSTALQACFAHHGGLTPAALDGDRLALWFAFPLQACLAHHGGLTPAALVKMRSRIAKIAVPSVIEHPTTKSGGRKPPVVSLPRLHRGS
jgi:hypothetical protein